MIARIWHGWALGRSGLSTTTSSTCSKMPGPARAVVACTSLHHVADVGEVDAGEIQANRIGYAGRRR